ncbi:MAG: hypothetical protein GY856_43855, partial [bacterium]|nr:hypothetical protein [bacterium]
LARLHFSRKITDGLLFARYRKLSAAVELHERQRDWKLIGSRQWYEEKLADGSEDR